MNQCTAVIVKGSIAFRSTCAATTVNVAKGIQGVHVDADNEARILTELIVQNNRLSAPNKNGGC